MKLAAALLAISKAMFSSVSTMALSHSLDILGNCYGGPVNRSGLVKDLLSQGFEVHNDRTKSNLSYGYECLE